MRYSCYCTLLGVKQQFQFDDIWITKLNNVWKEHFPIWTSRSHRFSTAGLEIVKVSIQEVKIYVFVQMVYYMFSISEQVKVGRYMIGSGKCHQSSQETRIQLFETTATA
jgi:hypothetical protein